MLIYQNGGYLIMETCLVLQVLPCCCVHLYDDVVLDVLCAEKAKTILLLQP